MNTSKLANLTIMRTPCRIQSPLNPKIAPQNTVQNRNSDKHTKNHEETPKFVFFVFLSAFSAPKRILGCIFGI